MCLVSFVPLVDHQYILSSNRDESPHRSIHKIGEETINEHHLIFPKDSKGGSWIYTSDKDVTLCLLNGAKEKHKHDPPYKLSRGVMLKDFFKYPNSAEFVRQYKFDGIEPFTCVIVEQKTLHELYWTGSKIFFNQLPFDKYHIWSSSPLYNSEIRKKRENWFTELFQKIKYPVPADLMKIHLSGGADDKENGFVMNRNNQVCTVSFTQISRIQKTAYFSFFNLLEKELGVMHKSFKVSEN
jgi:uncharacterized protein with NRDE domain